MPKHVLNDLTGRRFGKWVVLHRTENKVFPSGQVHTAYLCRCDCGIKRAIIYGHLVRPSRKEGGKKNGSGSTRGCRACFRRNTTIKDKAPEIYNFWAKHRHKEGTLPEWVEEAKAFYDYVLPLRPSDKHKLHLKEPLGGLHPDNVVWFTRHQIFNDGNRKGQVLITKDGETHTMAEWAAIENVTRQAIEMRIKHGRWKRLTVREKIGYESHILGQRKRMKNGKYKKEQQS